MKKLFPRISAIVVLAVLLITFATPAFATQTTGELSFEFSSSASSVKKGNTVEVTITLKNTTAYEITDLNFKLNFDKSKFKFYQSTGSTTPDWVLSHSATTLTESGNSLIINYSATDRTTTKPIGSNESFSVAIKLYADAAGTSDTAVAFSISDATASMRTDVTSNVISGDNLSHTFTFNSTYPTQNITITALSNNANLTSLVPMVNNVEKEMTPAFSSDVTQYRVVVLYEFPGIDFTITKADSKATAELISPNNNRYEVGDNTVQIVVTAEDGVTKKTYTIIIQRLDVGQTAPATTTSTTAVSDSDITTTTDSTTTTTTATTTQPSNVSDSDNVGGTIIKEGGLETTISLNLATLLGLVVAEIAMFLLAFYSGYMTHKNAIKPDKLTLDDIVAAQEQLAAQDSIQPTEPTDQTSDTSDQQVEEAPYQEQPDDQYVDQYDQQYTDQYGQQYVDQYGQQYDQQYVDQYGQPVPGGYDSQGYGFDYAQTGGYNPQQGYDDGLTQEFAPDTSTAAAAQYSEEEYDEYGYNAEGESNYQQSGPSSSIYYS